MNRFSYLRAASVEEAVREVAGDPTARFIAGGTNLIDLMKYDVERPARLIDITHLPLKSVEDTSGGGLRIGGGSIDRQHAGQSRQQQERSSKLHDRPHMVN